MGWSGQWTRIGSGSPDDGFTDVPLTGVAAAISDSFVFLYRVGSDGRFGPIQRISMAFASKGSPNDPSSWVWDQSGGLWKHAGSNFVPPGGATKDPVAVVPGREAWFMFARGLDQ